MESYLVTQLFSACTRGDLKIVKGLIKLGVSPLIRDNQGCTILHKACEKNHLEVVKFLVTEIKCDLEAEDKNSNRPLHIACTFSGSVELVSYLIKVAGCDINARGFKGQTILHRACEKNHLEVVKFLVTEIKCDLEAEDKNNDRPFHIACAFSGSVELVSYLIKVANCDINARGFHSRTILHMACEKNHLEVVKFLVTEIKCDLEAEDKNSNRPLHIACLFSGSVELVSYLIKVANCDINARGFQGRTILHMACEKNHLEVVKFLVTEIKCDLEAEDKDSDRSLHIACLFSGSVELVSYLIKVANCDINARGFQGRTILHRACEKNHLEVVKFLVTEIKCDLEAEDKNSDRPLHIACACSGSVELVSYLIKVAGCDINARGLQGRTILHMACEKNHLVVVKFLVTEIKCDLEAEDKNSNRPLHIACLFSGSVELVSYLIKVANCDINARGFQGCTILHSACEKNHLEVVKFLVTEIKCDLEAEDKDSDRSLHIACLFSGSVELVSYLIKVAGCDINARGFQGRTILHRACEKNHLEVVKFLVAEIKCDLESEDKNSNRPLHIACAFSGSVELLSYLIKIAGCDINARGFQGCTILHRACEKNHLEVVKFLVTEIKCDLEAEDKNSNRPLHIACLFSGSVELVSYLIKANCDVNARGFQGRTILHSACEKNHLEVVKFLVTEIKCDVEAEDRDSDRPLHIACLFSGSVELVSYLIKVAGCDINARGFQGRTILHMACEKNHLEVVKFLVTEIKCDLESEDKNSNRPLHRACLFSGSVELLSYLIKIAGCDINAMGLQGRTILHMACEKNHLEVVKFLVTEIKCDLEAEDKNSNRPLHIACLFSGSVELVSYLIKIAGCDINARGENKKTCLHYSCERNSYDIVKLISTQPQCNLEAKDANFNSPLQLCFNTWNFCICKHIIQEIARRKRSRNDLINFIKIINVVTTQTNSNIDDESKHNNQLPLLAALYGNAENVKSLFTRGDYDINTKGHGGYTLLHCACASNNLACVVFLIAQINCDVEVQNDDHDRPLHVASCFGNTDIVRYLVEKSCCDINAKGKNDYTPLHYACKHSSIEVMEYLLNHPDFDTDVLFSLSDYEDKHVQVIINFYKKFQLAMKSTGVAYLRVVKCILTGPPRAGKSTLKKRLLNESLIEPSLSTGVVDAAVLVNSFRKLHQESAIISGLRNITEWSKQSIDEEAVFVLEAVLSNTSQQYNLKPTRPIKYWSSLHQLTPSSLTPFVSAGHDNLSSTLMAQGQLPVDDSNQVTAHVAKISAKDNEHEPNIAERVKVDKNVGTVDPKTKAVKVLSEILQTIPVNERGEYEQKIKQVSRDNHAMLHIIDTGGQPEFHEILPALITGPAINLLVFKLTEDLTSRYPVVYQSSTGESQPYETSLTHEEVIFRSLASIACLRQNTIGWSFKESPIDDDSEPAAFLIATHRDLVSDVKVAEINKDLKEKLKKCELFQKNLIQSASKDQLIHALDTKKDQTEIDKLRSILQDVISSKFQELPIPVSWCTFSVKLRKTNKSLHDINSCYKLALECGITDREDFMFALWFLHHRVGSIMYYPEVYGLKDIVITDLQLVFDRITYLVTSCFTFETSGNAALENNFRTTGQFTEEDIIKLSKRSDYLLSPVIIVSLLKHLHIVAGPMANKSWPIYYFMPCALKPAAIEEEQRDQSMLPAPLLIYFECGYCPVGVFCCLVVHLISTTQQFKMKWTLGRPPHFRNKITFVVGKHYHQITLICRATYLEIWINPFETAPFYKIYQTLDKAIKTVTQSLHYMYKSRHFFGFPCTICQSTPPHPAICEYDDPVAAKCVQSEGIMSLNANHAIWFDKVFYLFKVKCLIIFSFSLTIFYKMFQITKQVRLLFIFCNLMEVYSLS